MNARPVACLPGPGPFDSANKRTFWSKTYANMLVSGPVSHVFVLTAFLETGEAASHGGSQPCLGLSYLVDNGASLSFTQITSSLGSKHPFGTLHV
jgi:hypothetical protein